MRGKDWAQVNIVYFPSFVEFENSTSHWILGVIDLVAKSITVYDSYFDPPSYHVQKQMEGHAKYLAAILHKINFVSHHPKYLGGSESFIVIFLETPKKNNM